MAPEGLVEHADPIPFALSERLDHPALDPSLLAMSGLEQVRTNIRGDGTLAPISVLLGMRPIEADCGSAVFAMPASAWFDGPDGRPQPGVLAPLADAAHSAAIATALPPGNALATLCLTLSYVARPPEPAEQLVCTARLSPPGVVEGVPAHSGAEIVDEHGSILARSTARCAVYPIPGVQGGGSAGDHTGKARPVGKPAPPAAGSEARGARVPADEWERTSGADVLARLSAGTPPLPPIQHLTGLRVASGGEGRARFELPASGWVSSLLRQVQGGALAMLAEAALDGAVLSTLDAAGARDTVELRIDFLRKVPASGELMVADASLSQRGRNFAFGACSVSSEKRGTVATAASVHRVL